MSVSFFRGENPLKADKLNQAFSERVSRGGDQMVGPLLLWRNPQITMEAATKQYVDATAVTSGGPFVPVNNPATGVPGMASFPSDIYQSPDSYALTGSMTMRGQPYGYYDTGTLLSLVSTTLPLSSTRAGINSGFQAGVPAIAGYGNFDEVVLYGAVAPSPPPLVLHNVTYDATHVFPQTPLTAAQIKALRVNMWVLTNSLDTTVSGTPAVPNGLPLERHYGSYVTGWATDGTSISVVGWTVPGSGHTTAGQVPPIGTLDPGAPNATAYFGSPTNAFAANFVMQNNSTASPDSRTKIYQGIEFDFQNWDSTDYATRAMGISMGYNAIGHAKLSADSWGMKIAAFPTNLILTEIAGYTDVLLNSFALNVLKSDSPAVWAGSPTTNLTWETQNYIDSNVLRLQCWTSRDSATAGWPGASLHLGMRVDGTPLTQTGGSLMAQVVWNPQGYSGGLQLQNQNGLAALTMDTNADVFLRANATQPLHAVPLQQLTASISAAAYVLPTASTTVLGGVKVDGTTVTISGGVISSAGSGYTLPTASTTVLGGVKIDGTTVTIASGVITAALPVASSTLPVMDGTATIGIGTTWARADHIHPTDTSRYAASNPSGYQTAAQVTAVLPIVNTVTAPLMDGTATIGTLTTYARPDHVHPTDTSRAPTASPTFTGTVTAAATNVGAFTATGITASPISGSTGSFTTLAASGVLTLSATGTALNISGAGIFYPGNIATASLPAAGANGVAMASDCINPLTNTVTGPQLVHYGNDSTWRLVGRNEVAQTTAYATIQLAPSVTASSTGAITATTFSGPLVGVAAASNAAAGQVGEYVIATVVVGSAVPLTTGVAASVTSISLTAGDWDITGSVGFQPAGTTTITSIIGATNTSAALPGPAGAAGYAAIAATLTTGVQQVLAVGGSRASLASTTTYFLVAQAAFGTSTMAAFGTIAARRRR